MTTPVADHDDPSPIMTTTGGSAPALSVRNVTRDAVLASDLEVAASVWAKFMGLMGRPTLARGQGLWLPGSNGIHMMFMRFRIDAVFVGPPMAGGPVSGETRPVISLHPGLPAWTGLVPLVRGAHGVLELPAGTIEATRTVIGDLIRFE